MHYNTVERLNQVYRASQGERVQTWQIQFDPIMVEFRPKIVVKVI